MNRRVVIVVGMMLTVPGLVFSLWLALIVLHAGLLATHGSDWWIENRSGAPVWVTPVAMGNRDPVPLPYYSSRLVTYSRPPFGEVAIQPGERRKLVIDGYAASDVGGVPGVILRTAAGDYRYLKGTPDGQFVFDDVTPLASASDDMVSPVNRPIRTVFHGVPLWLIALLGTAAPVTLMGLRRSYRGLRPAP